MFVGQVEAQDLLTYLYGQRHDIYGEGKDNICVPEVRSKLLNIIRLSSFGLYHHQVNLMCFSGRRLTVSMYSIIKIKQLKY